MCIRDSFRRDQEISADLPDKTDAEGPNVPVPKGVSLISFVDDCTIEVVHASQSTQVSNPDCDFGEEYETDSDDSLFPDDEPDYVTNKPVTWLDWLDLLCNYFRVQYRQYPRLSMPLFRKGGQYLLLLWIFEQ